MVVKMGFRCVNGKLRCVPCGGVTCCCPQFAVGPFPDSLNVTLLSPAAKYGANADAGIDGTTFPIPNFTSAECVEYRVFPQSLNAACGFVQFNFQLICEGTTPAAFTLTLTGASSGCKPVPTGVPINVDAATAQCDPLYLFFEGIEIAHDPAGCGCNGVMFDVEIR